MKRFWKSTGILILLLFGAAGGLLFAYRVPDRTVEELKTRWAHPPSQFVEIAGMQVHFRDEGPPEDPTPIILLHGTSASLHTWNGWAKTLREKHRVIRYDMPGFGLTGPAPDNDYTIENYARMVVAVLDNLRATRCILAGNSLGGHVAWVTAVLFPERVEKLVLVDASGYPFKSLTVPIGFKIARTPVINRLMKNLLPRGMIESSLKNVYGDPTRVTDDLVDRYFELTTRAGNREALFERFRQTKPGPLAKRIPELTLPTLILWGGRDRLIPTAIGDRFHKEIRGSKLVRFADLGHVPQEEDPVRTVAALQEFLNGLSP